MNELRKKYLVRRAAAAVSFALLAGLSPLSYAAEEEDQENELEEVVVTGSRLQGSAQAVLDERFCRQQNLCV